MRVSKYSDYITTMFLVLAAIKCKIELYVIVMSSYRSPGVFNGDFDGFGLGQVPGPVGDLVSQELPVDS